MADARAMYLNILQKDFTFTAAYKVVSQAPKWQYIAVRWRITYQVN